MDTSQYFYRNVTIARSGNQISLIDIFNPEGERKLLEDWFGMVVLLADGQHTIEDLHRYVSTQYNGNAPQNLSETLLSVVERLAESKFIVLTKEAIELPYYLSLPFEQLDLEKAKRLLKEDKVDLSR